jgi:hypothetical protein
VTLIDSADEVAGAVAEDLAARGLCGEAGAGPGTHRFAVSDDAERFRAIGARFLGDRLGLAETVALEESR